MARIHDQALVDSLTRDDRARTPGWAIVDARGTLVADDLPNRADAVRRLGQFAAPSRPLPLRVLSPEGDPSGDMIG
ncbi:MAG TPA: hypothetical protein VHV79_14125 [Mycobacteriales bacterium]|jgi:hypothetical protein|nr:hypothetical protein [Mycobacteriales bacterium]